MSLRIVGLRKTRSDGEIETISFDRNVTAIVGMRNTSKTTTLKMIDFCLGDSDSAAQALGGPVAENYAALGLDLEINGEPVTIKRSLTTAEGRLTKIEVDDLEFSTRDFQRWIMEKLEWPEITVPKGREYRAASEVVPLTFRTLLRHFYRKETSWLEFATREEEFHRRAVVAFFLGVAESRYAASMLDYAIGETGREIASLEARKREVAEQGDGLVKRLGQATGIDDLALSRLDVLAAELRSRRSRLQERRAEVLTTLRSSEAFVAEPGERFQSLQAQIEERTTFANELKRTAIGYKQAIEEIEGQKSRLERADAAVETFGQLPVHSCPACGQGITPRANDIECYLCSQPTGPDTRARRIELEIAALTRDSNEVLEVLTETNEEISVIESQLSDLLEEREALRVRLDEERSELIAPYMSEVESLSGQLGALEQQLAMISGLQSLLERVEAIDEELREATTRFDLQSQDVSRLDSQRALEEERATEFAVRMTAFLDSLRVERWQFGPVTIASGDFAFYLGPRRWDAALGAESKVLFFMAYTEGLLRLTELGADAHAPGVVILDNPLQHGVSEELAGEALSRLATSARELNQQLIVTLPRDMSFDPEAAVIRLTQQFVPQGT